MDSKGPFGITDAESKPCKTSKAETDSQHIACSRSVIKRRHHCCKRRFLQYVAQWHSAGVSRDLDGLPQGCHRKEASRHSFIGSGKQYGRVCSVAVQVSQPTGIPMLVMTPRGPGGRWTPPGCSLLPRTRLLSRTTSPSSWHQR